MTSSPQHDLLFLSGVLTVTFCPADSNPSYENPANGEITPTPTHQLVSLETRWSQLLQRRHQSERWQEEETNRKKHCDITVTSLQRRLTSCLFRRFRICERRERRREQRLHVGIWSCLHGDSRKQWSPLILPVLLLRLLQHRGAWR